MSHRYHKTPASTDLHIEDGAELYDVEPLDESLYDREETGPMFEAKVEGLHVTVHLFADEIEEVQE